MGQQEMYNFEILENSLSVIKYARESSFLAYKRKKGKKNGQERT